MSTLISKLPEPYRSQAIANRAAHDRDEDTDELDCAFVWGGTPEGLDYWNELDGGRFPLAPNPETGFTYYTHKEREDDPKNVLVYRVSSADDIEARYPNRPGDTWELLTMTSKDDIVSDRDYPECDESGKWLAPAPEEADTRIADLERRVAELEARWDVSAEGVWAEEEAVKDEPLVVDPGEGYRLVVEGERIEAGDEEGWSDEGGWSDPAVPVKPHAVGNTFRAANWFPVRRKIKPTYYRLLNPGEVIREGDELLDGINLDGPERWRLATSSRGQEYDPTDHYVTRRRISSFGD